jgi:oxygen-dependent protoporphyrinogen oxidase
MRLTVPTRWLPLVASGLFTWRGKARMLAERWVKTRGDAREESVESFVVRRFGRECFERVGEPLLAGIHCGAGDRLSMDVLFPRLVAMESRYGSVSRGMAAAGSGGTAFASLAGGMRDLIDALRRRLPGDAVWLDHGVDDVRTAEGGFEATLASAGGDVHSEAVVLALPLHATRELVRDRFPSVAAILERIPTVSSAVVFHAFSRDDVDHPLDAYGFVVPKDEPNRLLAATFITSKLPGRAPKDQVLIRTFLGGLHDPGAMALGDDELIALSRSELARAIGPLGEPTLSKVVRWENRTPQVQLGHREILDELDDVLARTPGLYLLANGLRGVGIPDCIGEARATAKRIARFVENAPQHASRAGD